MNNCCEDHGADITEEASFALKNAMLNFPEIPEEEMMRIVEKLCAVDMGPMCSTEEIRRAIELVQNNNQRDIS